jgi:hypothetical protein
MESGCFYYCSRDDSVVRSLISKSGNSKRRRNCTIKRSGRVCTSTGKCGINMDNICVVRRLISKSGKNKCRRNCTIKRSGRVFTSTEKCGISMDNICVCKGFVYRF